MYIWMYKDNLSSENDNKSAFYTTFIHLHTHKNIHKYNFKEKYSNPDQNQNIIKQKDINVYSDISKSLIYQYKWTKYKMFTCLFAAFENHSYRSQYLRN